MMWSSTWPTSGRERKRVTKMGSAWFIAAIVSAFALSGQSLAFQRLQQYFPIKLYLAYVWLGAALVLGLVYLRLADLTAVSHNLIWLILSALCSLGGIFAYNRAIQAQSNLGYVEAVMALRIVLAYVVSLFLFDATVDLKRLLGVIFVTIGVYLVAERIRFQRDAFQLEWVSWALAAGLFFGLLTVFVRLATDGGVSAQVTLVFVLLVAGLIFLVGCITDKTPLRPPTSRLWLIAVAILFAIIGNAAEFISFETTPNLAYAIAIDNTRMIILYVISLFMFTESLQKVKAVGIGLAFVGVLLLG